jgi:hypothetical protein
MAEKQPGHAAHHLLTEDYAIDHDSANLMPTSTTSGNGLERKTLYRALSDGPVSKLCFAGNRISSTSKAYLLDHRPKVEGLPSEHIGLLTTSDALYCYDIRDLMLIILVTFRVHTVPHD